MQYRSDRRGEPISLLGFGCMRFTRKGNSIDIDKAETEIMAAVEAGVNYFDTAYLYPGSEACLGEIVERNGIRDKIRIATKLPQYFIKSPESIDKYFNEELSRLRTDHVDYYLMHMLTDISAWQNLCANGIEDWIKRQKEAGRIRQIGFSFHGNTEMFKTILDAYDWDFCQIQYNYLDEHTQAGRAGLMAAYEKGIPVIIMEPLRGGKLVSMLPAAAKELIAADPKGRTAAELALRWLWQQPAVTCVLSGMNSIPMAEENCRIASEVQVGEFDEEDFALIEKIRAAIHAATKVGCTGCRYCMPCPAGVDIPGNFYFYNLMYLEKKNAARVEFVQNMGLQQEPGFASQCIGCGKCETQCPQKIDIRTELKKADRHLRPLPFKAAIGVVRAIKKRM